MSEEQKKTRYMKLMVPVTPEIEDAFVETVDLVGGSLGRFASDAVVHYIPVARRAHAAKMADLRGEVKQ